MPEEMQDFDLSKIEYYNELLKEEKGLKEYAEKGFSESQIQQLRMGIAENVEISTYADKQMNWMQMRELRLGLQHKIDISIYNNIYFSAQQMKEIRLGLEKNLDVTSYAHLRFSTTDMHNRRLLMEDGYLSQTSTMEPVREEEVPEKEWKVECQISDDKMEAFVFIPKDADFEKVDKNLILEILSENKVSLGIDNDAILNMI